MHPRGLEPLTPWFVVKYSIQLSYGCKWCRGPESNRHGDHSPQDFKSCASTCSATPALEQFFILRISLLVKLVSERRDSNPRPPPWQGDVLPLNYFRKRMPAKGVEPSTLWLQIRCSTNWAKPAEVIPQSFNKDNAGEGTWTPTSYDARS